MHQQPFDYEQENKIESQTLMTINMNNTLSLEHFLLHFASTSLAAFEIFNFYYTFKVFLKGNLSFQFLLSMKRTIFYGEPSSYVYLWSTQRALFLLPDRDNANTDEVALHEKLLTYMGLIY